MLCEALHCNCCVANSPTLACTIARSYLPTLSFCLSAESGACQVIELAVKAPPRLPGAFSGGKRSQRLRPLKSSAVLMGGSASQNVGHQRKRHKT